MITTRFPDRYPIPAGVVFTYIQRSSNDFVVCSVARVPRGNGSGMLNEERVVSFTVRPQ
jgi:hypothetical protein